MDDQKVYWKDKIDYITVNTISHDIIIHFLRPSIPTKTYKSISWGYCTMIRNILAGTSADMVYDANDFTEFYYGVTPEIYNRIFDKYLIKHERSVIYE